MKTFFVKYSSGLRQIYHSLHDTIEAFVNEHFGSAWDHAKEHGAHIGMTDHDPDANLTDPKYDHHFCPAPPPPPPPAPVPPPPAPAPAPEPPPPTSSGDVSVGLTGAQSDTAAGTPQQ